MNAALCSIATSRHRTAALACLRSAAQLNAGIAPVLLAMDDEARVACPGIRIVSLSACIPAAELTRMRRRYTTAELCFAAKPYLIAYLLENGADEVHYLDGDCRVFASLDPLRQQLAGADLLLTPHSLMPIPDDDRTPSALTVLRGGAFNGGYLGVRNTTGGKRFAQWLASMTRERAHNDPDKGMCGDQRWLDLVPALFPGAAICRHPGANVAYWNLQERELTTGNGGGFRANGQPLLFFHFSGYQPQHPDQLSKHQNRHPVIKGSPLAALLDEYRSSLA